jgi:hypothetical protein
MTRQCYIDKHGWHIYVERRSHFTHPWWVWHEEKCAFPPGARQVGAYKTLDAAQARLDRMAVQYGWQPCGTPAWVKDEEGR